MPVVLFVLIKLVVEDVAGTSLRPPWERAFGQTASREVCRVGGGLRGQVVPATAGKFPEPQVRRVPVLRSYFPSGS